jgi:hypothetical protein
MIRSSADMYFIDIRTKFKRIYLLDIKPYNRLLISNKSSDPYLFDYFPFGIHEN